MHSVANNISYVVPLQTIKRAIIMDLSIGIGRLLLQRVARVGQFPALYHDSMS